jgi:hypothetical protein
MFRGCLCVVMRIHLGGGGADVQPGVVAAAVVDGENLKLVPRVAVGRDREDRLPHQRPLVEGRNDDRQRGQVLFGHGFHRPIAAPHDDAPHEHGVHQAAVCDGREPERRAQDVLG